MKNLKKVLAVVLAVAMAFSLMAVASAKQIDDYTDTSDVKYKEAVDLISGLGIMTGTSDTTFDPKGTFTREQAAKVICIMLIGKTVADSLTATTKTFDDVEVTRWSAPFIEYCAVNGIINGTGDGKFSPASPVTGSAFAKMLLTALGYGAKGEYVGANWELNTLVKAQGLGILDTGVNYSAPATREEVAKYAFNALTKCKPVTYNSVTGTYSNTYTFTKIDGTEDVEKNLLGYSTFKLVKKVLTNTYYGALSHYWQAYTTTLPVTVSGTYTDDNVLYTNTAGYPFNLTNVTTPNSGYYKVSLDSNVKYFLNGTEVTDSTTPSIADLGTKGPTDFGITGKVGVITKYIDNTTGGTAGTAPNGLVDIVYITQLSVAYLNAAPAVDAAGNVTLSTSDAALNQTFAKTAITYPSGMAARDYFTYVKWQSASDQGTYIQKATKVTGQITASNPNGTFIKFAGTDYFVATLPGVDAPNLNLSTTQNRPATAWISADGYIIMCKPDVLASYNIGLVVGYNFIPNPITGGSAQVRLYTNDGKVAVYDVAPSTKATTTGGSDPHNYATEIGKVPNQTDAFPMSKPDIGTLVAYSFDANGKVTVWPVEDTRSGVDGHVGGKVKSYTAKSASVSIDGTTYYINSATKVFYYDGDTWNAVTNPARVLTGAGNTLAISSETTVNYVVDPLNTSLLDAIHFKMDGPIGTSGNYAYITLCNYTLRNVNNVNYYDYSVYVNGATTPTTLTSVGAEVGGWTAFVTKGLFSYTVDGDGYITSATPASRPVDTSSPYYKVNYVDSSFVGYTDGKTNMSIPVNENTKYFQVNPVTLAVTEAKIPVSTAGTSTYITDYAVSDASGNPALYIYYYIGV